MFTVFILRNPQTTNRYRQTHVRSWSPGSRQGDNRRRG